MGDKTLNWNTPRMFFPKICVIVTLILTLSSALDLCSDPHEGPCKRSTHCAPGVTPENSTHLRINWDNIFDGCQEKHIEKMEIQINEGDSSEPKNEIVTFGNGKAVVLADPCLMQTITISLIMTLSYSNTNGRS